MNDTSVVYLARQKSGLAAFHSFLESYRRHPAGLPHSLVIVWKGFRSDAELTSWLREASDLNPRSINIRDFGFDLRAYGVAAQRSDSRYLFLLNSFSQILADDWLAKVRCAFERPDIGLAGATGSWESMYSNALLSRAESCRDRTVSRLLGPIRLTLRRICFQPFPNPHIRTNAFMMRRDLMREVWPGLILAKRCAYLFENGRDSLTRRVGCRGLKSVVVGKDGVVFESDAWPNSGTFRQPGQQNLLVGDNQTRLYEEADGATQRMLAVCSWGDKLHGS
jgi:hypothetical protein